MPQVIVNKAKGKEEIESLELLRKLAKQVLSQLSYTPTADTDTDFKAFVTFRKLPNSTRVLHPTGAVAKVLGTPWPAVLDGAMLLTRGNHMVTIMVTKWLQ